MTQQPTAARPLPDSSGSGSRIPGGKWVSADAGQIDRRIFSDPGVYARELTHLFARSWLFLAHDSQIPKAGDFVTTYIGETPVIVARGGDGSVYANINSCRHRGLRVCRADSGNATSFACPYHGWTYGIKGELRGWPKITGYAPIVDKSTSGLVPVRCESYKGMLFGNFDSAAEPLSDFLGEMKFYLDTFLDRSANGISVVPGIQKRRIKANWKFPTDNLIGDRVHGWTSHRSVFGLMGASWDALEHRITDSGHQVAIEGGHGSICSHFASVDLMSNELLPGEPGVNFHKSQFDAVRALQAEALDRLGEAKFRTKPNTLGVFPNLTLQPTTFNFQVAHPRGPGVTEIWTYLFGDDRWPQAVLDSTRKTFYRSFGPAGLLEQDDIENWEEQTLAAGFAPLAGYPLSYESGIEEGFGKPDATLPGLISSVFSDAPNRMFYSRWQEMMS